MAEVIVFPDAAAIVITYLDAELTTRRSGVTLGTRIPRPEDGEFVRILRTGGITTTRVSDGAQLTVESYADAEEDAHDLAQLVRGLLHALQGTTQSGVAIYGVTEFSGPQSLPDPVTDKPRFTQTLSISMRGSAA